MITTHNLPKTKVNKPKRRVGRGYGSGRAKTSGRGMKGQGARSKRGYKPGFEGGQSRLFMRLPKKRGTRSVIKKHYHVVNIEKLNQLSAGTLVTQALLYERGWVSDLVSPIKILGTGDCKVALTFKPQFISFSKPAWEKIEKAGGKLLP